ncbi:hypothetical protein [Poseidonocella pacifica]|nr:hypothetical protein [Poseidonocella pacifica]
MTWRQGISAPSHVDRNSNQAGHTARSETLENDTTSTNNNRPNPLNEPGRPDAEACRIVLTNQATIDDAVATLSSSETIAVALAFGRADLLPSDYRDFRSAWRRHNTRQRTLMDLAAKARWPGRHERVVCRKTTGNRSNSNCCACAWIARTHQQVIWLPQN